MIREKFIKLKIGETLYNKKTYDVIVLTSQWSDDKKDNEYLGCDGFDGSVRNDLPMGSYDEWEYLSDDMPEKVQLHVLNVKLQRLERFVHERFR